MIRLFGDLKPVLAIFWDGPRGKLICGLLLAIATALSGLALLGLSGWFITATAIAGSSAATALAFDVFSPSAGIRFFALARTGCRYGERLATHDATLGTLAGLRERLFRGSAGMREAEKLRMRPAALLFRLTQDIDALDSLYLRVIVPVCAATAAGLAVGFIFGLFQPAAGIVTSLFLLSAGLGLPMMCARLAEHPAKRRMRALELLRSRTIDLISGQTELVMAGRIDAQRQAVADAELALSDANDNLNVVERIAGAAFGVASSVMIASTLYVAVMLARSGEISAPIAALAILVSVAALDPFSALRRGAIELGRTAIAARRVRPRLASPTVSNVALPRDGLGVCLDGISVRHPYSAQPSISNLSLSVRSGERLALVGASGAGKSTLMALMAGELSAEAGGVQSVPATLLTQRTELFADTLRDNLRLADPAADDGRLMRVIASVGLNSYLDALPRGLDTRLGEGGMGLSGGEARRLALARLFLRDTPLWLLDEPTEGLDDSTARDVISRLAANAGKRTLIIATHIRREAEIADRLILLERGRIVASASRSDPKFDSLLAALRQD